ncbi:XkdX family protein [Paenibacillus provencensis]|uniref:XkdX family protein n=1 Tax=Paenibacillus provencensis TaxID=441151 RepID=A0ABW3PVV3_9BACL|nr:XkdX family protein [Paenibacillus sp. MER 78]MCM3129029.1 XkdX family protein [Paenibacillus sp. MER 78]
MWYSTIKRYYDNGHPLYTDESLKTFVVAQMITANQYKLITDKEYTQ